MRTITWGERLPLFLLGQDALKRKATQKCFRENPLPHQHVTGATAQVRPGCLPSARCVLGAQDADVSTTGTTAPSWERAGCSQSSTGSVGVHSPGDLAEPGSEGTEFIREQAEEQRKARTSP